MIPTKQVEPSKPGEPAKQFSVGLTERLDASADCWKAHSRFVPKIVVFAGVSSLGIIALGLTIASGGDWGLAGSTVATLCLLGLWLSLAAGSKARSSKLPRTVRIADGRITIERPHQPAESHSLGDCTWYFGRAGLDSDFHDCFSSKLPAVIVDLPNGKTIACGIEKPMESVTQILAKYDHDFKPHYAITSTTEQFFKLFLAMIVSALIVGAAGWTVAGYLGFACGATEGLVLTIVVFQFIAPHWYIDNFNDRCRTYAVAIGIPFLFLLNGTFGGAGFGASLLCAVVMALFNIVVATIARRVWRRIHRLD